MSEKEFNFYFYLLIGSFIMLLLMLYAFSQDWKKQSKTNYFTETAPLDGGDKDAVIF